MRYEHPKVHEIGGVQHLILGIQKELLDSDAMLLPRGSDVQVAEIESVPHQLIYDSEA